MKGEEPPTDGRDDELTFCTQSVSDTSTVLVIAEAEGETNTRTISSRFEQAGDATT
jgi:hypothetical protein